MANKIDKKRFWERLWDRLFRQKSIFGRFWGPRGDPKMSPNAFPSLILATLGPYLGQFWAVKRIFFDFASILGCFWTSPGPIFG